MQKIVRQREGWKKPPEGKLIINVDGSFRVENGNGGAGVVIRDSNVSFIAGSHAFFEHDAPAAETMTLKGGLLLAQHIGYNSFILQLDCSEVVETIRMGWSAAASAPIYDDCLLLWQDFGTISIERCDREANMVAHELARVGLSLKESCIWIDEPPQFITKFLVNNVTMFNNQ